MLGMSPILTSDTQKSMSLFDKFDGGDCGENEVRGTFASTKGPIGANYPTFNHVSHAVSNFVNNSAKNVSNYLTPDAKRAFDQLRQAFIEVAILQHFDPGQYIQIETDVSSHAIGEVLSQLTNDLARWYLVAYFSRKMILAETRYET